LSSFQKYSIEAIVEGHHVLVCVPTGSGKTLVALLAILLQAFDQNKRAILTTPIKALSNQKFSEFTSCLTDSE
jgi:ATP-dependent RNA helicase HelY